MSFDSWKTWHSWKSSGTRRPCSSRLAGFSILSWTTLIEKNKNKFRNNKHLFNKKKKNLHLSLEDRAVL